MLEGRAVVLDEKIAFFGHEFGPEIDIGVFNSITRGAVIRIQVVDHDLGPVAHEVANHSA